MVSIGRKVWGHMISIVVVISLFSVFGCGDSGPDRVSITPEQRTLEVGDSFQFKATAWAKNKELSGLSFAWQVKGDAGTVDGTGRFTARVPGEAVIMATTGDITGQGKVVVKPKPVVEAVSEAEIKKTPVKTDVSGLQAVIVLDEKGYEARKRKPVTFSHLRHADEYGVACIECHHEYQNGKNVWNPGDPVKKCVDCHDPNQAQGEVMKLENAFHRNCRDCHRQMVDEGQAEENLPYRRCADCHRD